MDIRIVQYSNYWAPKHEHFVRKHWNKVRRRSEEYIYWKFRGKEGQDLKGFILAIDKNDNVVGQLGLVPATLWYAGQKLQAQWFCDLMFDVELRGKGLAKKLYDYAFSYNCVSLGSDPSPAARYSMIRSGFSEVDAEHRFIIPVSLGKTLALKFPIARVFAPIQNPALSLKSLTKSKEFYFESGVEDLMKIRMNSKMGSAQARILHDHAFMSWRYQPFENWYRPPQIFIGVDKKSYFTVRLVSGQLVVCEYSFDAPEMSKVAILKIYSLALSFKAFAIQILADSARPSFLSGSMAIRRKERTRILYKDLPNNSHLDSFHYTGIDSDEGI
jgi:hypothetical protein